MTQTRINRFFSVVLLFVYSVVVFHEGVFSGLHIISHIPEVLASRFIFHSHDGGHMHMHHHNLLEVLISATHDTEESKHSGPVSNNEGKEWSKVHVIAEHANLTKMRYVDFKICLYKVLAHPEDFGEIVTPPPEFNPSFSFGNC
ncbi:MAG: hypothetical protein U5K79_08715 [Cyclobacteriaceae bacterium]|nr:hypothetical protein [Cyclobacteriaceae bacterium]